MSKDRLLSDEELREQLRNIIKAPMRSKISTADIAVGMWSSTMLSEKLNDIVQLITADRKRAALEARLDELKNIPIDVHQKHASHTNFCMRIGYRNARIREIQQQLKAQQEEV